MNAGLLHVSFQDLYRGRDEGRIVPLVLLERLEDGFVHSSLARMICWDDGFIQGRAGHAEKLWKKEGKCSWKKETKVSSFRFLTRSLPSLPTPSFPTKRNMVSSSFLLSRRWHPEADLCSTLQAPSASLGSIRNRATLRSIEVLKEKLRRRSASSLTASLATIPS